MFLISIGRLFYRVQLTDEGVATGREIHAKLGGHQIYLYEPVLWWSTHRCTHGPMCSRTNPNSNLTLSNPNPNLTLTKPKPTVPNLN